jgi:hypothetical protein
VQNERIMVSVTMVSACEMIYQGKNISSKFTLIVNYKLYKMKKLGKLKFNSEEILKNEELVKLIGGGSGYPKIDACDQKKEGDDCSWTYNGSTSYGKCRYTLFAPLHCSTGNF